MDSPRASRAGNRLSKSSARSSTTDFSMGRSIRYENGASTSTVNTWSRPSRDQNTVSTTTLNTLRNPFQDEHGFSTTTVNSFKKPTRVDTDSTLLTVETAPAPASASVQDDESNYPHGIKLALILISLYMAVFLTALDRTIIATAVPKITDQFHSVEDIGWYGTAFLLPGAAFMLLFGKIYTLYSPKWVFLSVISIFEIGSAVCGAAPSSTVLIAGRAIAGLGSAGVFSGAVVILVHVVPLRRRPIFQGLFGAVFGVSSIIGPLIGGAFTDRVSWRWCFYINLPFGGLAMLSTFLLLQVPTSPAAKNLGWKQHLIRMDPLGTALSVPGIICLCLAVNWGGTDYAWNSWRIILLLTLAGVLLLGFVASQAWEGDAATVPPRIITQRSVFAAFWYATCSGSSQMVMTYYIPIWFQVVKGVTAVHSGIRLIALVVSMVVGTMLGGAITFKTGFYTPTMLVSSCVASVGAGLISTWGVGSPTGVWIGFQIVYGFGLGLGMQQPNMAVQTVLSKRDVAIGASLVFFAMNLGGAVFLSVAQNVFQSQLAAGLDSIMDSGRASAVVSAGATSFRHLVPASLLPTVLVKWNDALRDTFYLAVALSAATILGSLAMEWRSVKKGEGQMDKEMEEKRKSKESFALQATGDA